MLFFSCLPEWCHLHSDSAYTKPWQHSASTVTMATALHLPYPEPPGATQATIGQYVWLTGALSNGRGSMWCHWKDRTRAEIWIRTQSVRDLLLTQQLNKGGCHISSSLFKREQVRANVRLWDVLAALPVLFLNKYNQLTQGSSQCEAFLCETWKRYPFSPANTHSTKSLKGKKKSTKSKVYMINAATI